MTPSSSPTYGPMMRVNQTLTVVPSVARPRFQLSSAILGLYFLLTASVNALSLMAVGFNPRMMNTRYMYVAALSAMDVCVSLNSLLAIAWLHDEWGSAFQRSRLLCKAFHIYFSATVGCSLVTVMLITFDRFLFIRHPFFYINTVTVRRSKATLLVSWLLSIGYCVTVRAVPIPDRYPHCDVYALVYGSHLTARINGALFLSLTLSPFFAHFLVYRSAARQALKILHHKHNLGFIVPDPSLPPSSAPNLGGRRRKSVSQDSSRSYVSTDSMPTGALKSDAVDNAKSLSRSGAQPSTLSRGSAGAGGPGEAAPTPGNFNNTFLPPAKLPTIQSCGNLSSLSCIEEHSHTGPSLQSSDRPSHARWDNSSLEVATDSDTGTEATPWKAQRRKSPRPRKQSSGGHRPSLDKNSISSSNSVMYSGSNSAKHVKELRFFTKEASIDSSLPSEKTITSEVSASKSPNILYVREVSGPETGSSAGYSGARVPLKSRLEADWLCGDSAKLEVRPGPGHTRRDQTFPGPRRYTYPLCGPRHRGLSKKQARLTKSDPAMKTNNHSVLLTDRPNLMGEKLSPRPRDTKRRRISICNEPVKDGRKLSIVSSRLRLPLLDKRDSKDSHSPLASPRRSLARRWHSLPFTRTPTQSTISLSMLPHFSRRASRRTLSDIFHEARVMTVVRLRILRRVVGAFVFLMLCWLPYTVQGFLGPYQAQPDTVAAMGFLLLLNSLSNFVAYTWSDCNMRQAIVELLFPRSRCLGFAGSSARVKSSCS